MPKIVKVTMTDKFSGRSLSFRVQLAKWNYAKENGTFDWMTDYQRYRAENFFGRMAAYYTTVTTE